VVPDKLPAMFQFSLLQPKMLPQLFTLPNSTQPLPPATPDTPDRLGRHINNPSTTNPIKPNQD
jgi:hypothetical protein